MQILNGSKAQVMFAAPVEVAGMSYTGEMSFSIIENGNEFPVDPVDGVTTQAVTAKINADNLQILDLTKVAEGVPFTVLAAYTKSNSSVCSVPEVRRELQWAATDVFVPSMCVAVTE